MKLFSKAAKTLCIPTSTVSEFPLLYLHLVLKNKINGTGKVDTVNLFVRATGAKQHQLSDLKNKNHFTVLNAGSPRSRRQQGRFL